MSDISETARISYDAGIDPLDYAEGQIRILIEVHMIVIAARLEDPASFPGFHADVSLDALSRRILGDLLDIGWKSPEAS